MTTTATAPVAARPRLRRPGRTWALMTAAAALLVIGMAASLGVGSKPIALGRVWDLLLAPDGSFDSLVVHEQRLPRTLLLVAVGAALGVAGALMQSLTRNPLADPGLLGINAGAALAVVVCVAVLGLTGIGTYVWFALAGAAGAAVGVYVLGMTGRASPTPARLALAGVAITMTVTSLVQSVILTDTNAFNEFRLWAAGSVEGRGYPVLVATAGLVVVGLVAGCALAPSLNALALGEAAARALGVHVGVVRAVAVGSVTVLAGAATAAAGPILFVGLGVPYLARAAFGPDQRLVLPATALCAPVVLLAADILARLVVRPGELPVGVVAAILGGPVFVLLVRRRRVEAL